jgi:SpoVK/Ycf46/Vps4 family AAA+-type ATPase
MQEKKSPVYVVATANNISNLPAELLRKGRFDEIFFIDLPTFEERKDIFRIHLNKRHRDCSNFDIDKLAEVSNGYTGAEIEAAIISSMYEAFDEKREISTEDIVFSCLDTTPISKTMQEQVAKTRDWAKNRAKNASIITKKEFAKDEELKEEETFLKNINISDDEEL